MNFRKVVILASLVLAGAISNNAPAADSSHPHHVSVFTGATTASSHTHFTIGLDYEFRVLPMLGVGLIYDHAFAFYDTNIVALGFFAHPFDDSTPLGALKFVLAPGVEFEHGHSAFVFRLGTAYDIPVGGNFTVSPTFNFDWIENGHTAVVYGLSFGMGF